MSEPEAPVQYIGYPRGEQRGLYGTVERLQSLGDGYFGLKPIPALLLVLILLYDYVPFFTGAYIALVVHAFVAVLVAGVLCLAFRRIAFGVGWPKSWAILPAVFVAISVPIWSVWAQGSIWGIFGFCAVNFTMLFVASRIARNEIVRYGIAVKGYIAARQKEAFEICVEERKAIEANAGLPPVPNDMFSPPQSRAVG